MDDHRPHDEPIPVRIVREGEDAGRDEEARLRFEVWVLKLMVVLYVVGRLAT